MHRADPQRKASHAPRDAHPARPRRSTVQDVIEQEEPDDIEPDDADLDQQELAARREDDDE